MDKTLYIWNIILWGSPIIGAILFLIAKHKTKQKDTVDKERQKTSLWVYIKWIAPVLGAVIYLIVNLKINSIENKIQIQYENKNATEGIISNKFGKPYKSKNILFFIFGTNSIEFNYEDKDLNKVDGYWQPFIPVFNDSTGLTIKISSEGLSVSALFRGLDGKIIAEINNNEWEINPNNYYKRNYDKKGIEVIDNYGVPVMQLDFIGKDSIFFGGAYRTESRLYILGDNGVTSYNADKMPSIDQYLKLGDNIKKIFKYPSDKNFGVRENNNR